MLGVKQNSIQNLPQLKNTRYENIFKLYTTGNKQYYYNLLQSIYLPQDIDDNYILYQQINQKTPWTIISFNAYKTIDLWWLICLTNKIYNPIKFPEAGSVVKIIKPQYIATVLSEIKQAVRA